MQNDSLVEQLPMTDLVTSSAGS